MSDYKISVLVTFYNQENYVDRALSSIFSQKVNFKFKVIIGDDGSSDNTVEIIKNWMKKHNEIELIIRNHNDECTIGGFRASKNRLNLLKKVSTDYFIFLDGDDFFSDDNKLQIQYNLLENEINRDCIGCAHAIDALYRDGTIKPYSNQKVKEGKYGVKEYWKKYYFHTDTILFRSLIINKINFDLLENNYNDNVITYSAIQFGMIYYLPKSMAVYSQTGDGIWTTGNQITNNIRNMFLYDICIIINPKNRFVTNIRFGYTWLNLLKLRKQISKTQYSLFLKEAKDKRLKYSVEWLTYNDVSHFKKLRLLLTSIPIIAHSFIYNVFRKMSDKISK